MQSVSAKMRNFDNLLTPKEAAKTLGVSVRIVYRLIRRGLIEYVDVYQGKIEFSRIKESVLHAYIQSKEVKPIVYPTRTKKAKTAKAAYVPLTQLLKEGAFENGRKN